MAKHTDKDELYEKLLHELRRGVLVLAVLSRLETAEYGYSLKQKLHGHGLDINEGTLYPLLRRLESQGLLQSEWEVVDDARPRRYYKISSLGKTLFANLSLEWHALGAVMNQLLTSDDGGFK